MSNISRQIDLDALQNVEPAKRRQLWDRLPGEPERAFRAFTLFRDAAAARHVSDVGAKLSPPCTRQNVWRWSFRWRWEERAAAYDVEQDRLHRDQMARDRVEMNRRHLRVGMLMQSLGVRALSELQARADQGLPLNLSADEARALLDAGARMERAAHGPERESRFTSINVILSEQRDDEDDAPLDGDKLLVDGDEKKPS